MRMNLTTVISRINSNVLFNGKPEEIDRVDKYRWVYYGADNIKVHWEVRIGVSPAMLNVNLDIRQVEGLLIFEDTTVMGEPDHTEDFKICPEEGWEFDVEKFNMSDSVMPFDVFPKGIDIDYATKKAIVYFAN